MEITAKQIIGKPVEAAGGVAGKIDDIFFDVRTGDITHASVALRGWYRGNVVLIPLDSCCAHYANRKITFHNMSVESIRQAPLLDEDAERNAEISQMFLAYEDITPCWNFNGRCCINTTRSESIEKKTGQPALWGLRDLLKSEVYCENTRNIGIIENFAINIDLWQLTRAMLRKGPWYLPERFMVPIASILEVEKSETGVRVRMTPVHQHLAA